MAASMPEKTSVDSDKRAPGGGGICRPRRVPVATRENILGDGKPLFQDRTKERQGSLLFPFRASFSLEGRAKPQALRAPQRLQKHFQAPPAFPEGKGSAPAGLFFFGLQALPWPREGLTFREKGQGAHGPADGLLTSAFLSFCTAVQKDIQKNRESQSRPEF